MDVQTATHLRVSVCPGTEWPYCVLGDCEEEIGRHHACVQQAEAAIRSFCREQGVTATVRVFTPRGNLWKEDEIGADGDVARTTPHWLKGTQKAA